MGRHMLRLLKFMLKYPGWHSISTTDTAARRAASRLCNMGLAECNQFGQYRACIASAGMRLTLAQVRDGTGFPDDVRFIQTDNWEPA